MNDGASHFGQHTALKRGKGGNGRDPLYNAGTSEPVSPAYVKASAERPMPPNERSLLIGPPAVLVAPACAFWISGRYGY